MYNLLPPTSEKTRSKGSAALVEWFPAQADPAKAKISPHLRAEFTVLREEVARLKINAPPRPERRARRALRPPQTVRRA